MSIKIFEEEWVVALDARATRGENILADYEREWGNFLKGRGNSVRRSQSAFEWTAAKLKIETACFF
jgi:hypothetical protein